MLSGGLQELFLLVYPSEAEIVWLEKRQSQILVWNKPYSYLAEEQ